MIGLPFIYKDDSEQQRIGILLYDGKFIPFKTKVQSKVPNKPKLNRFLDTYYHDFEFNVGAPAKP